MHNSKRFNKRMLLLILVVFLILIMIIGIAASISINQANNINPNPPVATPTPTSTSSLTPTPTPTPKSTPTPTPSPTPPQTSFQGGLNYLSASNRFFQDDTVTRSDFEFFKANDISCVSIRIVWKSFLEYNVNETINNYNRLLTVADDCGMKVQLDFWTSFNDSSPLKPVNLTSFSDIIRNQTTKTQWLSFVNDTMRALKSHRSIESWTMMNEPYSKQAIDEQLFYQCWAEQYALMKSIDSRPVSIRFALGSSPWSGDFDKIEVFSVCDYISINEYLNVSDPNDIAFSATWSMFEACVTDCRTADKPLFVTEFGCISGNDEAQRVWYNQTLSLFKDRGITKAYAWAWQTVVTDYDEQFNIAGPPPNPPKPAFYELAAAYGYNYN